jgi:hypothetical protein
MLLRDFGLKYSVYMLLGVNILLRDFELYGLFVMCVLL